MTRVHKLVVIGIMAGGMSAIALITLCQSHIASSVSPAADALSLPRGEPLARCRRITEPDAACEAIWEAHRRHFLGQEAGNAATGRGLAGEDGRARQEGGRP